VSEGRKKKSQILHHLDEHTQTLEPKKTVGSFMLPENPVKNLQNLRCQFQGQNFPLEFCRIGGEPANLPEICRLMSQTSTF